MNRSTRRRWPWVLMALAGFLGTLLGVSGILMAGSFGVATRWPPPPGYEAHWHRVGQTYLWVTVIAMAVLIAAIAMLWRRRREGRGLAAMGRAS